MLRVVARLAVCGLAPAAAAGADSVDFTRDIEPIFREKCYSCHGPDQQLGQLRLDSKAVVFAKGVTGKRIVPHKARASMLYSRVAGKGELPRMPLGGKLADAEIGLIERWIEEGAAWPEDDGETAGLKPHWAFVPPEKPTVPHAERDDWAVNPIDRFVLARLEKERLAPSPRASKETLLRRLSLDLVGLPPSLEEIDAYLSDGGEDAYRKQVQRLLDSPHFGERWGRYWLDAARYADSDGFEKDKPRKVWFYRDWVVKALNRDMPYDRFVVEQIAGDLLPNAAQDQLVATGFLRNSMINEEGGANPEQFRMEAMFDRMDAVGKAVLGLTIQCAQCHNHKFDPISQEEYYRIFAFLNNSHEAMQAVYAPEEQQLRERIFSEIAAIEDGLRRRAPDWPERMAAWERETANDQPAWRVLDAEIELGSGEKYEAQPDKSILAQGYAPTRSVVSPQAQTDLPGIRAVRLELLTDPRLRLGGPGRSFMGTAALTEFEIEAAPAGDPEKKKKLKIVSATADVNPPLSELDLFLFPDKDDKRRVLGEVDFAIDGFEMSAWSIDGGPGRRNQPRKAVFQLEKPLEIDGPVVLTFNLVMKHGGWNSDDNQSLNLGRYRFSVTADENAVADPLPAQVRHIVSNVPRDRRTPEQEAAVFRFWRTQVPEWEDENRTIEALWAKHPEGATQLVLSERETPRMTRVLQRGDFLRPADRVEPGVPEFLHALKTGGGEPTRLDFARWLVDRDSPTTARAIVNRIWQAYFGIGLVETSEDLGRQAPAPSHPELLDWLAVELMENGWSLKRIHRLIVLSATYRQSSQVTPGLYARDPRNRLLARGSRFRLDGEAVRDAALAASGLLNPQIGGEPVYPPAPEFLFLPPVSYGPKRWYTENGPGRYRRSLYAFRYRSVPYPVLDTFDTPNGNFACVKRDRSNTPLQALATLNETLFFESARSLGRSVVEDGGAADAERMDYAFRRALTRRPSAAERNELLALLEAQRARIRSGSLDAWPLIAEDRGSALSAAQAGELAAWTAVSRVLLNLDETITRE